MPWLFVTRELTRQETINGIMSGDNCCPELPDLDSALADLPWSDVKRMAIHLHRSLTLSILDQIQEDRSRTAERRIYSMELWLKNDLKASWAKVVEALRKTEQSHLANKLESQYCALDPGQEVRESCISDDTNDLAEAMPTPPTARKTSTAPDQQCVTNADRGSLALVRDSNEKEFSDPHFLTTHTVTNVSVNSRVVKSSDNDTAAPHTTALGSSQADRLHEHSTYDYTSQNSEQSSGVALNSGAALASQNQTSQDNAGHQCVTPQDSHNISAHHHPDSYYQNMVSHSLQPSFNYQGSIIDKSKCLGQGSYGAVYQATCGQFSFAAKIMSRSLSSHASTSLEQFHQLFSLLTHPNVVQYLTVLFDSETRHPVLLMELYEENLTVFMERSPAPLPYHTQLKFSHDITLALVFLHSKCLIHKNLSSNNVLFVAQSSKCHRLWYV